MSGLPVVLAAATSCVQGRPDCCASAAAGDILQTPQPNAEIATAVASPVRSRWKSAPAIPPASIIAPVVSPHPGPGCIGGGAPGTGLAPAAAPLRAHMPVMSYPPS